MGSSRDPARILCEDDVHSCNGSLSGDPVSSLKGPLRRDCPNSLKLLAGRSCEQFHRTLYRILVASFPGSL